MVGDRGVTLGRGIKLDLVTVGGLAVELKAQSLQLANDFPAAESGKSTHI